MSIDAFTNDHHSRRVEIPTLHPVTRRNDSVRPRTTSHASARRPRQRSTRCRPSRCPTISLEYPPNRQLGRPGDAGGLRAGASAAQGAHAPSRRRLPARSARSTGIRQVTAAPNGYLNVYLDRAGVPDRARVSRRRRRPTTATARRSSNTRRSIRTRPHTSATCATPRSATRSSGCCASAACRWRSRTTSTTPASRWPTSSSASACSRA